MIFYNSHTILKNQITVWKKKYHDLELNNNLKKKYKQITEEIRKRRWKGNEKLHKKDEMEIFLKKWQKKKKNDERENTRKKIFEERREAQP